MTNKKEKEIKWTIKQMRKVLKSKAFNSWIIRNDAVAKEVWKQHPKIHPFLSNSRDFLQYLKKLEKKICFGEKK